VQNQSGAENGLLSGKLVHLALPCVSLIGRKAEAGRAACTYDIHPRVRACSVARGEHGDMVLWNAGATNHLPGVWRGRRIGFARSIHSAMR